MRDPAAYLRRSALAIDRDFNVITGIERILDRSYREMEDRGIELALMMQVIIYAGLKLRLRDIPVEENAFVSVESGIVADSKLTGPVANETDLQIDLHDLTT